MDDKKVEYMADKVEELEKDLVEIREYLDYRIKFQSDLTSQMAELIEENQQLKEDADIGQMFKWAIKEKVEFISLPSLYNYGLEIISEEDVQRLKDIYRKEGNLLKCNKGDK